MTDPALVEPCFEYKQEPTGCEPANGDMESTSILPHNVSIRKI